MRAFDGKYVAAILCLAMLAALIGCRKTDPADLQTASFGEGASAQMQNNAYEDYDREPYAVRTVLREYTAVNQSTGQGAYGRFTELVVEGNAPDTFRDAIEVCNRRAEEAVRSRIDEIAATNKPSGNKTEGYRYVTYGYITNVTRADQTAFSILETEFEKQDGQSESETTYEFRGTTYDTASGKEIPLADLAGDEAACSKMLEQALLSKYGIGGLASTAPSDYAWTADALGVRFYFDSDAVSADKRREIGDYTARAVTVAFSYSDLSGTRVNALSAAPDSYIAMIEREKEYSLPHGDTSVLLTQKDDSTVFRIMGSGGETQDLIIEYADNLSDYYIIRAEGGFYLFRERIGYQEGFFYDFSRPDGGFGRFANTSAQYFDSFLREILLALPYNPYCVHMAEVKRSFGETSYDKCSFVPHGHYSFPSAPDARYKCFVLTDKSLQIDSRNVACRLLEDFAATEIDADGHDLGEITVPAGSVLLFESVDGEAMRYADPPRRRMEHSYYYVCRLTDGRHIRFESTTESTMASEKGYLNRFTEPISLGEAEFESESGTTGAPQTSGAFTVRIGGKEYPLIPDYSKKNHLGEEIDFGGDIWWQVEGYPGRYVTTDTDYEDMQDAYFTQEALSHPDERAELVIGEDGSVVLDFFDREFTGNLPKKRFYRENVAIYMESETESRTFRIILREGEEHTRPVKIELFSEGLPATNEPSNVPTISVYMTREAE